MMATETTTATLHQDGDDYASAAALYCEASIRDPRRFPFGYLAGDPASGAIAGFVWFRSPAELLDFLLTIEVRLLRFDERESASLLASLKRTIGTTRDVRRLDRRALSAAFDGWGEIVWIGTFADLCERGGDFQTSLRAEFRIEHDLGEHGGPIADDEIERFVAYLAASPAS